MTALSTPPTVLLYACLPLRYKAAALSESEEEATKILAMLFLCAHFNLAQSEDRKVEDLKTDTDPESLVLAIKESMPE